MSRDYIKVSPKGVEAGGRYVLHALYGYLGFQLICRFVMWTCFAAAAASGSVSLWQALARSLA
jgi:hypothetical protein